MKQLIQELKSGTMRIEEVPTPIVQKGMILVRNHFSLISAGTEGSTVRMARKSLIGKAKAKPQQVKQVIDTLHRIGPVQTYRAVMKKLEAYSPLGYSSSGVVIAIGDGVSGFKKGDKVACAGVGYANHAEVVSVPKNLCVKLDPEADLLKASYNSLGAIALQGIRQADLRLGESCLIIGLGLIGQLTAQILDASGIITFGIDISENSVSIANKNTKIQAWKRGTDSLASRIIEKTNGFGVDAVIITAGTDSLDPINFSGEILRRKGRVVIVGAVPTGFNRDPFFYKKEIELKMSCSYGPGRYDMNYEEKGIDYPYPYVRWTENRNMFFFQELVQSNRINIDYLTTHIYNLGDASSAYDMMLKATEPFLGIAIKYDVTTSTNNSPIRLFPEKESLIKIGFIGAGSYAQSYLLPYLRGSKNSCLKGVMTNNGTTSKSIAEKYGFEFCTSRKEDIFLSSDINTVFIASRHDSHGTYVIEALRNNKKVFVEKPLAIAEDELITIIDIYENSIRSNKVKPYLMVGYNRRFSPLAKKLKNELENLPVAIIYRVNAGEIPTDTWIQDLEVGGGRILGEVCHFIDFMIWLSGSLPVQLFASAMNSASNNHDVLTITIQFSNGSIGSVHYFANGSKSLLKEYIEVYQTNSTFILKDFKVLEFWGKSKKITKMLTQDKGQEQMLKEYIDSLVNGHWLIKPEEIFTVSKATFKVIESLKSQLSVTI